MIATALLAAALLAGCGGSSGGGAGVTAQASVTISSARQYQRIAGFGVSEGFGQAKTLMNAPAPVQQQVLSLLYSPTRGAGLTILRNEISADAWSAPAFMKTNDSAISGGTLCGVPGASCTSGDWRQAYADYLVQYAKDYAAAGVPLGYVGPENETTIAPPQDSMIMNPAQTANVMGILGATLARSGLSTRAECCASVGWNYAQQYAAAIETDKAASTATALFTSHGYFAAPDSPLRGWSKPVWETEWAPFGFQQWDPAWDDGSPSSGFTWAQNIYTGLTAANLNAFLYLWGADTTGLTGPNTGLVEVEGNTVATSGRLWAFAGYSRFIRPGAVRIGTTTSDAGLDVTAFRNSDGSIAVVVLNTARSRRVVAFSLSGLVGAHVTPYLTDTTHQFSAQSPITVRNSAFTATLPPRSLVTDDIRS